MNKQSIACSFLVASFLISGSVQANICMPRKFDLEEGLDSFVHVIPVSQKKENELLNQAAEHTKQAYHPDQMPSLIDTKETSSRHLLRGKTPFGVWDDAGLVVQKGNDIWVTFRGTKNFGDVVTDLKAWKTSLEPLGFEGQAHAGFLERYLSIRDSLVDTLKFFDMTSETRIHFTGHSMGGALATLAAADIQKNKKELLEVDQDLSVSLKTFCSPRVLDSESATHVTNLLGEKNIKRLWRSGDPVSAVSPGWMGFQHVGQKGGYRLNAKSSWWNFMKNPGFDHSHNWNMQDAQAEEKIYLNKGHKGMGGLSAPLKKALSLLRFGF